MIKHLAAVAVLTAALVAAPAAAFAAIPETRPASPPGDPVWAVALNNVTFPSCTTPTPPTRSISGGWSQKLTGLKTRDLAVTRWTGSTVAPTQPVLNGSAWLGEPCWGASGAGLGRLNVPFVTRMLPYSSTSGYTTPRYAWGTQSAPTETLVGTEYSATCQSGEWAQRSGAIVTTTYVGSSNPIVIDNYAYTLGGLVGSCTWLREFTITVCGFAPPSAAPGFLTQRCTKFTWNAEQAFRKSRYIDPDDPRIALCALEPSNSECMFIDPDSTVSDPLDFAEVCSGAPVPTWGDFAWLGDLIGHYTRCLWVPLGGFNRLDEIGTGWESGGAATLGAALSDSVSAYDWTGTCGSLGSVPIVGKYLTLDTCTWTWANPVRDILGVGVLALGGFFILRSGAGMVVGVINRKATNPVPDGDGDAS